MMTSRVAVFLLLALFLITLMAFSQPIVVNSSYLTCFDTPQTQAGWIGTGDFELSSSFTKLGGPYNGTSWVTKAGPPGTPYSPMTLSSIVSPEFDLSNLNPVYVSFFHSIQTSPGWDRSIFQYSLDSGATWVTIGNLNEPYGANWYYECVYNNAACSTTSPDCFDEASADVLGFPCTAAWTSNGECAGAAVPTGPDGWVFCQVRMDSLAFKKSVRFRYLAFSGNRATRYDGWAFDCFAVFESPPLFGAGTIFGTSYLDTNGNASNDSEPTVSGDTIALSYYGCSVGSTTTGQDGSYVFYFFLPGTYAVTLPNHLGYALTEPTSGSYTVQYLGDGSVFPGRDFGKYQGSVSGSVFNDLNDNGLNEGEPGIAAWTIELHQNSCGDSLVASTTTDTAGNYHFIASPGTYAVKVVVPPGWRRTYPESDCRAVAVTGTSGSVDANPTGTDFGGFQSGKVMVNYPGQWNLVSVPVSLSDMHVNVLFPGGASNAFAFIGEAGYESRAVLENLIGYWLTIDSAESIEFVGVAIESASVNVTEGWNLIGSLSAPIDVSTIVSEPPGLVTSNFFGYNGTYTLASIIEPGKGYWVKLDQNGMLTLSKTGATGFDGRIRIVPTTDRPPSRPSDHSDLSSRFPQQFSLGQNYPNPFNPITVIRFEIRDAGFVALKLFDVLGREVATIVNEKLEPGEYTRTWDASKVPSGVYFYRLSAGTFIDTKKMLLLR